MNDSSYLQSVAAVRGQSEMFYEKHGRPPMFFAHHYGCQQNVSDGEKLNGLLLEMGYTRAASPQDADLVLFNTCAVRENAEQRIFGNVGALKHAKARNPDMIVALCGCMMEQEHVAEKIKKSFPYVDIVFGAGAMRRFPALLYNRLSGGRRQFETGEQPDLAEGLPIVRDSAVKAWVPIMHGCDNFCSYCVVPLVRGRERSREPADVLREITGLVREGYREFTLLGQNVNSYGKGLVAEISFSSLLRDICAIEGDFRIRFMTSHPKDCTRELVDTIAANDKICNHIHLPVQSGSNRILSEMNRRYTREEYLALIDYAKETIPGCSFSSDIIVGFPGETDADFAETLSLVKDVGYHALFTFLYSPRRGTKAAGLPDDTPQADKMRRFQTLLDMQQEIGNAKYRALAGNTVRVLAEGTGKTGADYITGRTESNVIVDFLAPPGVIGQFCDVNITEALNWAVLGEIITN